MTDILIARGAPPPAPPQVAGAMRPGTYLAKRRHAAGLDVDTLAQLLAFNSEASPRKKAAQTADFRNQLQLLEADHVGALRPAFRDALVHRLRSFFNFEPEIYATLVTALADPAHPVPQICAGCGCTWNDACQHPAYGACAWAETPPGAPPHCTHCALQVPRAPRRGPEGGHRHAA